MDPPNDILANGTRLHQAGRLAEAERAYRQVLAADPRNPHALHQLGMLAMQSQHFSAAVDLIRQAIQADRNQAAFHANLGEAYRHSHQPEAAMESYRRALELDPKLAPVHMLMGMMLHDSGNPEEAATALREALRLQPDEPQARMRLGLVLDQLGKHSEAESCFRRALRHQDSPEGHFNLAAALHNLRRNEEAIQEYQAAIERKPDFYEAHNNLGTVHKVCGQWVEAERHFLAAARLNPRFAAPHVNLGLLRLSEGRFEDAVSCYQQALSIEPREVIALHGLGTALHKLGRSADARRCFEQALAVDPDHVDSLLSLSYLHQTHSRFLDAIQLCQRAVKLRPDSAEAHNNLCVAYSGEGRQDESIEAAKAAIAIQPEMAQAHCNLALALQHLGRLDEALVEHREAVRNDAMASGLHSNLLYMLNYLPGLAPEAIFSEHRAWAERHAEPLTAKSLPHLHDRSPQRQLRLGYVSPHFCAHAVNFFVEPILQSHDHSQFEIYCYSDVKQPDSVSKSLRGYADAWRETASQTNEQVAQQIRTDEIDILVDLTGHIAGGERMLVFARKPSPVQVTYIGYQNTSGMTAMDYRLTDDYSDPPGETEHLHTEQLVRLPGTFFCYQPSSYAPPVGPSPAAAGPVTFGSVNAFTKVTPQVLDVWAEILSRVPQSRLVIRADITPSLKARLESHFGQRGIAPERLELVHRLPRPRYLELIARLDIAFDPFPFNGHTTTCDCLWQGVPVITLSGQTYVQRFGGSALHTLGLNELITQSPEDYISAAVSLANDRQRLAGYRWTLRDRMAASPLLDFAGFTRNLEAAYRQMWQRWCNGG